MRTLLVLLLAHLCWFAPVASTAWAQANPADRWGTGKRAIVESDSLSHPVNRPLSLSMRGYTDGLFSAGQYHDDTGWFWGGFAGGLCLGLIGTIAITAAASSKPQPPAWEIMRIDTMGLEYCGNFIRGYGVAASSENMSSAFGGGLLGTVCIVAIYFLVIKK